MDGNQQVTCMIVCSTFCALFAVNLVQQQQQQQGSQSSSLHPIPSI
jgi:hypothetical protein